MSFNSNLAHSKLVTPLGSFKSSAAFNISEDVDGPARLTHLVPL